MIMSVTTFFRLLDLCCAFFLRTIFFFFFSNLSVTVDDASLLPRNNYGNQKQWSGIFYYILFLFFFFFNYSDPLSSEIDRVKKNTGLILPRYPMNNKKIRNPSKRKKKSCQNAWKQGRGKYPVRRNLMTIIYPVFGKNAFVGMHSRMH